jgi:diaminopimelate decarboxylase
MNLQSLLPDSASYSIANGLRIANYDLASLARQWSTPLYIYDGHTIYNQVSWLKNLLRQHYAGPSAAAYAAKAYFSLAFARKLAALDLGVDVVSLGELEVALKAGFLPGQIHLHGNNKSEEELAFALASQIQAIVVDSLDELAFLEQLAAKMQLRGRIWLRITPGISPDTHEYIRTAHLASKFGLPLQDGQAAEGIRQARQSSWLSLSGLHFHLGSQFFEPELYRQAIALLAGLAESTGYIPVEISPGGGWGVPYNFQDQEADPTIWIQAVSASIQAEFQKRAWPLPKLVIEPGRWIAGRAGLAIYTVGAIKTGGDGTRFAAIDGGMADNIRPALYQARYVAIPVQAAGGRPFHKYSVVGKYCESGDVLIHEVELPELKRGDLLAVPVSGAYHLSMASNYNLTPRPAVLWLENGRVEVLQRRERIEDIY